MNCKRVEALVPLYAGGDVDSRTAGQVQAHLEACGPCAALAAEYEASRHWLSGATPDLDEALLFDMKRGVMRELQTARSRPGFFELMKQAFARTALSPSVAVALLLVVVGGLTFWFYLSKPQPPLQTQLTQGEQKQTPRLPGEQQSPASIEPSIEPGIESDGPSTGHRHRLGAVSSHRAKGIGNRVQEAVTNNTDAIPEPQPSSALAVESGGMLRIEMQTADPTIRIIWFAPREIDGQQSNP